jgi:hypothetical protein
VREKQFSLGMQFSQTKIAKQDWLSTLVATEEINTKRTSVCNNDGIHFTAVGYRNLASRTLGCLKSLVSNPKKKTSQTTYFWRGFRSRRGSSPPRNLAGNTSWVGGSTPRGSSRGRTRGGPLSYRSRGFHPYRNW